MSDTSNNISVISDTSGNGEFIYDTTSVSEILGVQKSTLRKYCALMQKYNYEFNKNAVGHRVFYKKDVEVIKEIVDLKNSGSLTLSESVKAILDDIADVSAIESISNSNYTTLLEEFDTFKDEQQKFNQQLLEILQKQQDYIKNSIEERDTKLTFALKESMEIRRQLAAAEEEKEIEERKKKLWWQFWR